MKRIFKDGNERVNSFAKYNNTLFNQLVHENRVNCKHFEKRKKKNAIWKAKLTKFAKRKYLQRLGILMLKDFVKSLYSP